MPRWVSQFDLNVEHGEVERPFKPVTRIVAPVFKGEVERERLGVVVLNFLGDVILDRLGRIAQGSEGKILLINPEGYWLPGPEHEAEWGFMLEERKSQSMERLFPEEWRKISEMEKGQFITRRGLFTFKPLSPEAPFPHASGEPITVEWAESWKILSFMPKESLIPPWLNLSIIMGTGFLSFLVLIVLWWTEARRKHRESEKKFRLVLNSLPDAVALINDRGETIFWNNTAESIFGYTEEEMRGQELHSLIAPRRFFKKTQRAMESFRRVGSGKITGHLQECIAVRKNGEQFPVEMVVRTVEAGGRFFAVGSIRDITERKKAEDQLELASQVFENALEGVVVTDTKGTILSINRCFTSITGYTAEELIGKTPRILKSDKHDRDFYQQMWEARVEKGCWEGEIWNRRKSGEACPEWLAISAIKDSSGETTKYVGVFHDRTDIRNKEEQLEYQAYHDALTSLPNRNLFIDHLNTAQGHSKRSQKSIIVISMDIDNFKNLNETLGFLTGDEVLKMMGKRLSSSFKDGVTVSRPGGDEFLLLFQEADNPEESVTVVRRIFDLMKEPFKIDKGEYYLTTSAGIAVFPGDGETFEELIKNANIALYQAKSYGKNTFSHYKKEIDRKCRRGFYSRINCVWLWKGESLLSTISLKRT